MLARTTNLGYRLRMTIQRCTISVDETSIFDRLLGAALLLTALKSGRRV